MPGFLIPADLDRMIPAGVDPLAWAENNLLASPGALVAKIGYLGDVKQFRIQTLVPAVDANGACMNLDSHGLCVIHESAPFGCAFFDCGPERGRLSHHGLLEVYNAWQDRDSLYQRIWNHLSSKNLVQQKAEVLRMRMQAELEMKLLRAEGWTQADFAAALKKELE